MTLTNPVKIMYRPLPYFVDVFTKIFKMNSSWGRQYKLVVRILNATDTIISYSATILQSIVIFIHVLHT